MSAAPGEEGSGAADDVALPEVAVGAVVLRDGCVLLVQRGNDPGRGRWSVPGGRVRPGEALRDAVAREVREETGLAVVVGAFAGFVERRGTDPSPYHFVILDFFATCPDRSAQPVAGDDADNARFVPLDELASLPLVEGLPQFLLDLGVGPSGGALPRG